MKFLGNPDEISLLAGDIITEVRIENDEWYYGKNSRTGVSGLFPANYVKVLE